MKQAKPVIGLMDIAHKMHCQWCADAPKELRELWYKTHLAFWTKQGIAMATVRWAPFDLDIVTFEIPEALPEVSDINEWPSQQPLMLGDTEKGEPPIVTDKQRPDGTRASVSEVVDAFLEGQWTPYWHCASCRKRFNGNLKPI